MKKVNEVVQNDSPIRILKIGSCKSISGKSDLIYYIGCTAEDLLFKVQANSNSGYFSREWIAYSRIHEIISLRDTITSYCLFPLYVGRSTNSPAFLLAAIRSEGLIAESAEVDRSFVPTNPAVFIAEMKALMDSDIALDPDAKPKKVAAIKKAGNSKKVVAEAAPLTTENCAV